jgi:hypothetical protein
VGERLLLEMLPHLRHGLAGALSRLVDGCNRVTNNEVGGQVRLVRENQLSISACVVVRLRLRRADLPFEAFDLQTQRLEESFALVPFRLRGCQPRAQLGCFRDASVGSCQARRQPFDIGVRCRQLLLQKDYFFIHNHHLLELASV